MGVLRCLFLHEHKGVKVLQAVEERLDEVAAAGDGVAVLSWSEKRGGLSNGVSRGVFFYGDGGKQACFSKMQIKAMDRQSSVRVYVVK